MNAPSWQTSWEIRERGYAQADPAVARWVADTYQPEDTVLREIRERSERVGLPAIQVGVFDGLHLEIVTRACGVRRAVEIGTLGGYSGVCILRGLAPDGTLDTFERSPTHAQVAEETFARAGFADRVRIHVGSALERLPDIEPDGPYDLVFVDADKESYPAYLAWAAEHLRVGGVLLGDNAFGRGGVVAPGSGGMAATASAALRRFSEELVRGGRFRATMLPTEEGLAMGVKVR